MHLDVADLKGFYYRTNLGRAAQRAVRGRIVEAWPEARGLTVAGYGFAAPLLRPFLGSARRVMALMPAPQGVTRWPHDLSNVSVLVEEARWPIETGHVDRLVIMHGLETSEDPAGVLGEAARVLGPGGRMLVVVSNRAGLWSRRDTTPFGYGRPYSLGQIEGQLRRHGLAPGRHVAALFQPPTHRRFWLRAGPFLERVGRRVSNYYAGGVLIVEAGKHPPAPAGGSREAVRRPIEALAGMPEPARRSPHGLASAMGDRPGVAAPPRPFDVALPTCPSPAHARCAQPPAHPGGMARLAGLLDAVAPAPAGPARSLVEPGGRCYMPPEPAGEDDIG